MSRHLGLLILAVSVITYLEAISDDWTTMTGLRSEDKRGPAWTRLKKDNEAGVTFSDWARLKRDHEQWTRMKKELGVLTFTDWARQG